MLYPGVHKLILPLIGLSFLLCFGCGGSVLKTTRSSISVVGQAWMEADALFAVEYEKARVQARETSFTWEERDQKLARWETARDALVTAGYALKTAALAISIAEEGFATDWRIQALRAFEAIASAFKAVEVAGLPIPMAAKRAVQSGVRTLEHR